MPVATRLDPDMKGIAMNSWQVFKPPTGLQTALAVANVGRAIEEASFEETAHACCVAPYDRIRLFVMGEASDGHAPVLTFYGWNEAGPGTYIGSLTCTMGNYTPSFHAYQHAHKSIKEHFPAATTYRGVDTYAIGDDHESRIVSIDSAGTPITYTQRFFVLPQTQDADFPVYVDLDLSLSQYKWIVALVTDLGSATTAGVIFRPLRIKGMTASPAGFS